MTQKVLKFTDGVPLHETDGNIRVIGSRVTLFTIVGRYQVGDTVEEINEGFPSVSIAQINAIIAWYLKNQPEVDEYISEVEAEPKSYVERSRAGLKTSALEKRCGDSENN